MKPAARWLGTAAALAVLLLVLVLVLVFLAYLQPYLAVDLANRIWACF